jgi:zinc transporter
VTVDDGDVRAAPSMTNFDGVSGALGSTMLLDGAGGIRATSTIEGPPWAPLPSPAVFVLDAGDPRTADWLEASTTLDADERAAFLGPIPRTWAISLDADEQPTLALLLEPMERLDDTDPTPAATRLLVSAKWLIIVADLDKATPMFDRARQALRNGKGARTPMAMFIDLARAWTAQVSTEVLALDHATAEMEKHRPDPEQREALEAVHQLRRRASFQRQRIGALRTAIHGVDNVTDFAPLAPFEDRWRGVVREIDQAADLLAGSSERVQAIEDHLQNQLSAMVTDRLYVLTLISAIILPLSLISGLLGANIGGIPMRDSRWGFLILCLFLGLLAALQFRLVKRMRWLPRQAMGRRSQT